MGLKAEGSGPPLTEINWGAVREPYLSEITQKLAGRIGANMGQTATPTGTLPFIAPLNPLQLNSANLMNSIMGYGQYQQPGLQTATGASGGAIPMQGAGIPGPQNPDNPGPLPIIPGQPGLPTPTPIPNVFPMGQPGVRPMGNSPMVRPVGGTPFDPLRRR